MQAEEDKIFCSLFIKQIKNIYFLGNIYYLNVFIILREKKREHAMQEAGFTNSISSANTQIAAQNGQVNAPGVDVQKQAQETSIFGQSKGKADVNQSNTNSGGTGGLGTIFGGVGGFVPAGFDNTSIFTGYNRGSQYALYSKKDATFDVPKLTQEDIANQKPAEGPKRTNPKAYNIDMTPKENPFEAFRNPDLYEKSFTESITDAIAGIFGSKKAN